MSEQNADSPASAGTDAASPDDLAKFLASWDDDGEGKASPGKGDLKGDQPKGAESAAELRDRLAAMEATLARTDYQNAMGKAVEQVRGDLDVDDFLVEAWLNRKAENDPRIVEVWNNRDRNQAAFDETLRLMSSEFRKYAVERKLAAGAKGEKDTSDTSGNEAKAARAGARSAGAPRGDDQYGSLSGLDDNAFALKKAEIFKAVQEGRLS